MASTDTQYKSGENHPYFGKSSPAKGKHWKLSEETKIRMRKAQKGIDRPWLKSRKGIKFPSNSEELHPDWKGESAVYSTKHKWVANKFGKPPTCEICKKTNLWGR